MKFKLYLLFTICFVNLVYPLSNNQQNQTCKKYLCSDDLFDNQCLNYNSREEIVNVKKCINPEEFCPFMIKSNDPITCKSKQVFKSTHSFPGGKCKEDKDCIYGTCETNLCRGKDLGDACDGHNQCPLKSSCRTSNDETKTCVSLSNEGEVCTDDYDCLNNLGCNQGICTKYLSLALGASIDTSARNTFPLCESGFAYNGVCESFKTVGGEAIQCNLEENFCKYTNSAGEEVQVKESCLCGKNSQGFRYCTLGNDSSEWVNYLKSLKKILSFNFDNCNTLERTLCPSTIKNSKQDYDEFVMNSIYALKKHETIGAENCVIDIFFPLLSENNRKNQSSRKVENKNDRLKNKVFLKK